MQRREPHPESAADDTGIDDVFDELEELEGIVDSPEEREQVRETMRTLSRADTRSRLGQLRGAFGSRDAGEALVGSFLIGIPMIVEEGTLDVGRHIAGSPLYFGLTVAFGLTLTLGILHAARFAEIEADLLFGIVPVRLISILTIALVTAFGLMTIWGRVDWSTPWIALSQATVTAMVMAVGAAIGDILPE
jgi:uncharacterized membrane protein